MDASKSGHWATDLGLTLLALGLVLIVVAVLEPYTYNKTLTDIGYMLIGLSIQLLGLALVIIGKK